LLEELSAAQRKAATLETSFTADHPDVRAARRLVAVLDQQVDERIDGIVYGLKTKSEVLNYQTEAIKKQLAELTMAATKAADGGPAVRTTDPAARAQLKELLENEIKIAEQFASEQRKKVETGTLAKGEDVRFERDVLGLKRQLVAVDGLSSAEDRQRWRELLLAEIKLAEEAVSLEKRKLENGKSVASEVARLQRDVLILKRELVAFDAAPPSAGGPVEVAAVAAPSPEAEELALSERLLAQLQGWDLSQLRKLIPTLAPDADMERLEKDLAANQDELRTVEANRNAADYQNRSEMLIQNRDQLRQRIADRAAQIVAQLEKRIASLRERVARQQPRFTGSFRQSPPAESTAPTDEEEKEIRRIQALIKDSPDLINAPNVEVTRIRSGELMVPKNGTMLHKAASLGQLIVAKFLLEHGADVGGQDEIGRLPLHWAAGNGHKAMVELLLANKADVNAKSLPGYAGGDRTPLQIAVEKGYRSVCETLLAQGADPNRGDSSGVPPIFSAVSEGDEAILRLLLAKGAKVNPLPGKSQTPLHNAANTNIARLLIDNGAVVDALNSNDQSPLHGFARSRGRDLVELLLHAGADPRLKDQDDRTPLHLAAEGWNASVVAPLIARGANPNERNSFGGVPLDALIQFEDGDARDLGRRISRRDLRDRNRAAQLETLQAFLVGGADPNLAGVGNAPHLFRAVAEGLEEQVEALLKAGADPNEGTDHSVYNPSRKGQTALIRALEGTRRSERDNSRPRSLPLVNLLLEYKADPNLPEGNGNTPLFHAIASGTPDFAEKVPFVEALLKHGANIEGRNGAGYTPLATAVEFRMKEMVELLLRHKADPNAKTDDGKSLLHVAVGYGSTEILDALLAAGADPNALDARGMSALDYAKAGGPGMLRPGFGGMPAALRRVPGVPGQRVTPGREVSQSELAERLRKAGARDWAPRPGLITVTRRTTGASSVIFSRGTNDWNRHSLLEVIAFTHFGSETSFPFPDFSRLLIARLDPRSGAIKEFSVDLAAGLAAEGCRADQWLEWGDLVDVSEGVHKLDERWTGLPAGDAAAAAKCIARKVILKVKGITKELSLEVGNEWVLQSIGGGLRYFPQRAFYLRDAVLKSGLLLTSSDLGRVKVTRQDVEKGPLEWTFDLTKTLESEQDLWLRDGDVIEVPEKP
jgi:ankyrin repeat protein